MTAIYLLITLSPLASIGIQSKPFPQTITKECSGDCRTCVCSAERSASHTCCCWQKKLAVAKTLKQPPEHKSSPTDSQLSETKAAGSRSSKSAQHDDCENEASTATHADNASEADTQTVSISVCPCGSGKDLTFSGGEKTQHIPFRFLTGIPVQKSTQFAFLQPERLASHYSEPPDPPPKVFITS